MDKDLFMLLGEYLDIVLPQIKRLPAASRVTLSPGLNVMDLSAYTEEMQMLVVRSVVEWVHQRERNVIIIMPEAWKFIPEARMTVVKPSAEKLIREGAGLGNYVWMDSQDIAGIWKLMLRAATVWIVGVQREANEVRRTLDNIPAGTQKPKASDVMTLGRGEFFACYGKAVKQVYVQPAWMKVEDARMIATGERAIADVPRPAQSARPKPVALTRREDDEEMFDATALTAAINNLADAIRNQPGAVVTSAGAEIDPRQVAELVLPQVIEEVKASMPAGGNDGSVNLKQLTQEVLARLGGEEGIKMVLTQPIAEMEVRHPRETVKCDTSSLRGRCALFIAEGFFDQPKSANAVATEMAKRHWRHDSRNVDKALKALAEMGFLTIEPRAGFKSIPSMKVNVIE
jgi:hypothetical protein